ncbi:MAG: hypothetical protein O9322_15925 [Beijerinckiaceae bacterium]|nr:hypothetical protein [Beijerinckiaceae bacterium]MCZ8300840.1 hypothetical protein [Beijerinckiaceae bacterium]
MTRPGLLNPEKRGDDVDQSIRPLALGEFIGQVQTFGQIAAISALVWQRLKEQAK